MIFESSLNTLQDPKFPQKKTKTVVSNKISFDDISFKNMIGESVLDPVNKTLCQDIFSNNKLRADVKKTIKDGFLTWWKQIGYKESDIKYMIMIGSSTGYQYSKISDIDVNIQVDIDDDELEEIYKTLPNGNLLHDTQRPINYYLTKDDTGIKNADSSYDILKDGWIKEPVKSDYKPPYSYGLEIAKFFMYGIDMKIAELDRDVEELKVYEGYLKEKDIEFDKNEIQKIISLKEMEIKADLDALNVAHQLARAFRKEAFEEDYEPNFLITINAKGPNESLNNVIYKLLEKFGYFSKIAKYDELYDKYDSEKA